jgi:hypothetical protein
MRWSIPLLAVSSCFAIAAAVACGDDSQSGPTPTATSSASQTTGANMGGATSSSVATTSTGMGGQGTGGVPDGYPAGPYGNELGDTFPYLVWQGYVSTDPAALANVEPWTETYTSDDVRTSGAPYALIHTALST